MANTAKWGTNQTFIGLDQAYLADTEAAPIASIADIHTLAPGALAIFDENNGLIAADVVLADVSTVKNFWIAQGMPVAGQSPVKSILIPRTARVVYTTYKAPVLQVSKYGKIATAGTMGFPATPLNGTFATAIVTDLSSGQQLPNRTIRVESPVYSTDTVVTAAQRLRDALNAHPEVAALAVVTYVTGASDDHFVFTGTAGDKIFTVGFDDVFVNITYPAYTVGSQRGAFAGFGTNDQVVKLINESNIALGDALRTEMRAGAYGNGWWGVTDTVQGGDGLTFNVVTIEWDTNVQASVAVNHVSHVTVHVALLVGGDGNTAVLDILTVLLTNTEAAAGDLPVDASAIASGFAY